MRRIGVLGLVPVSIALGSASIVPSAEMLSAVPPETPPTATAPRPTVNEFLPEERGLGECISAVPKPGCGSEARGGWRQGLVLLAILSGLAVIAWRVVVEARRSRPAADRTRTDS